MKKSVGVIAIALLAFLGSYFLKYKVSERDVLDTGAGLNERIISMAPSSGEVIFTLGLDSQLVGVSRYMRYPESAEKIPKIGGYLDVDMEGLLRLQPTSVVLLKEQVALADQLKNLGVATVTVDHMSLDGIQDSIRILGEAYGREDEAEHVCVGIQKAIAEAQNNGSEKAELQVLISIGREAGNGGIGTITAAGAKGYHQELLQVIGVKNAYQGNEAFPQLSREHLLRMNPDIIIDLFNSSDFESIGSEAILNDWAQLEELNAVKNGQVYVLGDDVHFIPGPRFVETLRSILTIVREYELD
ncbi:ABC transporter substrate-binding protein [Rubritalea sp.]|uniref:ABC transporter substrate-binding protein n=1 Tax=Rubritalea sp. TaxID=2109375 RepID=UPI003EF1B4C2